MSKNKLCRVQEACTGHRRDTETRLSRMDASGWPPCDLRGVPPFTGPMWSRRLRKGQPPCKARATLPKTHSEKLSEDSALPLLGFPEGCLSVPICEMGPRTGSRERRSWNEKQALPLELSLHPRLAFRCWVQAF